MKLIRSNSLLVHIWWVATQRSGFTAIHARLRLRREGNEFTSLRDEAASLNSLENHLGTTRYDARKRHSLQLQEAVSGS